MIRVRRAPTLAEQEPRAYGGRRYGRLNDDYEPMHGLARFVVEHAGPRHALGEQTMVPFLLDMARLYERFVAAWLRAHLPPEYQLDAQDELAFGGADPVKFQADLVIRDRATNAPIMVLDTKYKRHARPSPDDLAQIVAYAAAWNTTEAVLIYPEAEAAWVANVGGVRVRALPFALDGDLETAGRTLLAKL